MDLDFLPLPQALKNLLPEGVRQYASIIVVVLLLLAGLFALIILLAILKFLFGRKGKSKLEANLEEDLTEYPDLKPGGGDRQLKFEGVPVRMRLVVVAPAGTVSEVDLDELASVLDKLVPGLGEIYKRDKPAWREWPKQVSYQGFATHFHRNTNTGAGEGEETRWAMIAGRAKLGKFQIMVGMALQSIKPNTIGRRTVDSHEWASLLRVRVKD